MTKLNFNELDDSSLINAASDTKLGLSRAFAIETLASRALQKYDLLDATCKAISSERAIGFHAGMPIGWLGADKIFLSGQEIAIQKLLFEMNSWSATEQEDLVRHWAGRGKFDQLSSELKKNFNWQPRYT